MNVGVDAGGSGGIIRQKVAGLYTGNIGISNKDKGWDFKETL